MLGRPGWRDVHGTVDKKPAHLTDWQGHVAVADARSGCAEAHQGRGVRNTSDAVTTVGARWGGHDVSKSRQIAAS